MTVFYSTELASIASEPVGLANATSHGARLHVYRATIALASQTTSDTIVIAKVPAGQTFVYGWHTTDTSLGSSTVAIGITGTTAKYKAAATFTATNTPTPFGLVSAMDDSPTSALETVFITISAATMPSSGIYVVHLVFMGT